MSPRPSRPAHHTPAVGVVARVQRVLFGDQVKRAHVSDHGAFMRAVGRGWAIPMTLVFSTGALVSLGQGQISAILLALAHHQTPNYVTVALLAITFVIVGGMDLTLLNSAVELRDARLRGVDPNKDPYTRGATQRVYLVSFIESATFMSVAYQLDQPPSFTHALLPALVAWAFIVMRALVAPVCAIYLATLGKRVVVRREMYGNLMLTIGGTIQQIIEELQFGADIRLIRPLWRMQRLVDRASRAQDDDEMDRLDEDLLTTLTELCDLRDRLEGAPATDTPMNGATRVPVGRVAVHAVVGAALDDEADDEADDDDGLPLPPEHLNRRKAVARMGQALEAQTRA